MNHVDHASTYCCQYDERVSEWEIITKYVDVQLQVFLYKNDRLELEHKKLF